MSDSELIPQAVLGIVTFTSYLSTACDAAYRIEAGPYSGNRHRSLKLPEGVTPELLESEIRRLHRRCRLTHKFTGRGCVCDCHSENTLGVMADCRTCRGRRILPDRSKPLDHNGEPPAKPCPDCQEKSP